MAPFANERKFRTICDWGNWIFPYDDLFDNGTMRNDHKQAVTAMNLLMASFDDSDKHELEPLLHPNMQSFAKLARFHAKIWNSVKLNSSFGTYHTAPDWVQAADQTDIRRRYTTAMKQYCAGTLAQVQQTTLPGLSHANEVLLRRRQSVCVLPLFALIEFAHDINLPDEIYEKSAMEEIRALGIDTTVLHNDLISYHKEESEGVPHNIIAAYRESGKTAQEAVDLVGADIERRSSLLERAIEEVSSWDSPWQNESMRYVQGVRDVIRANLYWSFHSDRFLSDEQKIRLLTTDMVEVSASSSHLCNAEPTTGSMGLWPLRSPNTAKAIGGAFKAATMLSNRTINPMECGRYNPDAGYLRGCVVE
jgi:hypothetical protein